MATWETRRGKPVIYDFEVAGEKGAQLTFSDAAILSGALYAGDDTAPLATLAPVWLDAGAALARVAIPGAATADLEPSVYQALFDVDALDGLGPVPAFEAFLRVLASPGTAPAPAGYCTLADLSAIVPWIGQALTEGEDQAGFAEQIGLAAKDLDRVVVALYERRLIELDRLGAPVADAWVLDAAVPYYGYFYGDTTWIDTQVAALRAALAAGRLVVDDDTRAIAARISLAYILMPMIGKDNAGTSFQALARGYRRAANSLLLSWTPRLAPATAGGPVLVIR